MSQAKCTFVAPPNKYGFKVYHTHSGHPMPDKHLIALYDLVLGPALKETVEEIQAENRARKIKTQSLVK